MFVSVPEDIFGHVIIIRDFRWFALSISVKTFEVIFALYVMIIGGDQSLLLPAYVSLWWKQMLCLPKNYKPDIFLNDKYK
jgi:hypothetical protein